MRPLSTVTIVLAVMMICLQMADCKEPAWKSKIKAFTKGSHPGIRPMTLVYEMSWNGILKSGQATMVFDKKHKHQNKMFLAQAYGRSRGVAGALFPFSFVYNSFMRRDSYQPLVFIAEETDKKEKNITKNQYRKNDMTHTRTTIWKKGGKVENHGHVFKQRNLHDTLSAMLYIRGRKLDDGEVLKMALHPFKSAQYAEVKVLGREVHRGYKCIKLDLKLKNVDMKSQELKSYKKLKKATLWISDDQDRILIEMRSKVFIGDVRMVLTKRSA